MSHEAREPAAFQVASDLPNSEGETSF